MLYRIEQLLPVPSVSHQLKPIETSSNEWSLCRVRDISLQARRLRLAMGVHGYLISARFLTTIGHLTTIFLLFSTIQNNIEVSLGDGASTAQYSLAYQSSIAALILGIVCSATDFSGIFLGTSLFNNTVGHSASYVWFFLLSGCSSCGHFEIGILFSIWHASDTLQSSQMASTWIRLTRYLNNFFYRWIWYRYYSTLLAVCSSHYWLQRTLVIKRCGP